MMNWLIPIIVTVLLLVVQHSLSTNRRAWLGAIIPTTLSVVLGFLVLSNQMEVNSTRDLFFIVAGPLVFFGIWSEGRNSLKRKRQKELDKMRAHDMS
ncbi:hypothetical protein [Salimicrobium jeotgali]|uniref:hypothetical protein n=1 Tax=Salimicrobium jeotgali TaxID=1230341 RepID=UPI000C843C9A|nr:hypothetical protein [Salimicrobium jeotgali]